MTKRDVLRAGSMGFAVSGVTFSNEVYGSKTTGRASLHLALGGCLLFFAGSGDSEDSSLPHDDEGGARPYQVAKCMHVNH